MSVEIQDSGLYRFTCAQGHSTQHALQEQKFELLFEIGACAILDGYYREAVSSFAASLERFFEFAIKVLLIDAGEENLFNDCWSKVSQQSERQLGAYIFLWASRFGQLPPLLEPKKTKFRNDVIHKGRIPTKEQAIGFGNAVLAAMRPSMLIIRERLSSQMQKVVFQHLRSIRDDVGSYQSTSSFSTVVSLNTYTPDHHERDLESHLESLDALRRGWRAIDGAALESVKRTV